MKRSRPVSPVPFVLLVAAAVSFVAGSDATEALGFNTGMFYRYPWTQSVSMTRTQGWGDCAPSHCSGNGLYYAVDWDDGSGNWPVLASNAGTIRCNSVNDGINETFGNYITVYNSVANQTAMYAHLVNCSFLFGNGQPFAGTQGQGLASAGETGSAQGVHLHFHVSTGDTWDDPQTTVAFAMSDKDNFDVQQETDGPSDNAPVAVDASGVTDNTIRNTYLIQSGTQPASESWWNVGAPYQSINQSSDEWGGPCRNTATALVHLCPSNFGAGIAASQNYIDWKGVRHSVYHTNLSGHVKGQVQGALSAMHRGQPVARMLGAPLFNEASNIQVFQGGYAQRNNGAGIKVYIYTNIPGGGYTLQEILHYDAYGAFCPSINNDRVVSSGDQLLLVLDITNKTYSLSHDINGDGAISAGDQLLVAMRFGMNCIVADP